MHPLARLFNYFQRKDFLLLLHRPPMDSREATSWYPDWVYETMETDEVRNREYRAVIESSVMGRTVLELGTGRMAFWARFCSRSGAKKVFAIEANSKSVLSSRKAIQESGYSNIELVPGFSDKVTLPERCEVLVHDLVGAIGSCEGMVSFLEDAKKRFLTPTAIQIPKRCTTYFFPSMVPTQTLAERLFGYLARGGKSITSMPVVLLYGYRREAMLAEPKVFEDLFLDQPMSLDAESSRSFVVERDGDWDAIVFSIKLWVDDSHVIDSLESRTNWYLPYIRPFPSAISVKSGQTIRIDSKLSYHDGRPSYFMRCFLSDNKMEKEVGSYQWSGV